MQSCDGVLSVRSPLLQPEPAQIRWPRHPSQVKKFKRGHSHVEKRAMPWIWLLQSVPSATSIVCLRMSARSRRCKCTASRWDPTNQQPQLTPLDAWAGSWNQWVPPPGTPKAPGCNVDRGFPLIGFRHFSLSRPRRPAI